MNDTTKAASALDSCVYCGDDVPVGGGLTAGVTRDADGRKRWIKSCSLPCHKKHLAEAVGGRRCVTCGKKYKRSKSWLCSASCRRAFNKRVKRAIKEHAKSQMPNDDDADKRVETARRMLEDAEFLRSYWRGEAGPQPDERPPQRARLELGNRVSQLREALRTAKQAASRKREQESIDRRNEEHRKKVEAQRQADREWRDQLLKGADDGET